MVHRPGRARGDGMVVLRAGARFASRPEGRGPVGPPRVRKRERSPSGSTRRSAPAERWATRRAGAARGGGAGAARPGRHGPGRRVPLPGAPQAPGADRPVRRPRGGGGGQPRRPGRHHHRVAARRVLRPDRGRARVREAPGAGLRGADGVRAALPRARSRRRRRRSSPSTSPWSGWRRRFAATRAR